MRTHKASRRRQRGHGRTGFTVGLMLVALGLGLSQITPAHGESRVGEPTIDAAKKDVTDVTAVEPAAPDGEEKPDGSGDALESGGDVPAGTDGAGADGSSPAVTETPKLNMASLEKKIRATSAIGFFTKLEIKGQVDDLIEQFRGFHDKEGSLNLGELRQSFNLLLLKVLTLLQDSDPGLSREIGSSRLDLWQILSNPAKFAEI